MLTKIYPANPLWECSVQNLYLYTRYAFQNNVTSVAFFADLEERLLWSHFSKEKYSSVCFNWVFLRAKWQVIKHGYIPQWTSDLSRHPVNLQSSWTCFCLRSAVSMSWCVSLINSMILTKKTHQTNKNKKRKENNNKKHMDYKSKRILIFLI